MLQNMSAPRSRILEGIREERQKNKNAEKKDAKEPEVSTDDHTSSSDRPPNNSIVDIGERKIDELMNVIHKKMNAAKALTTINIELVKKNTDNEVTKSDNGTQYRIYRGRETKARLIVGTSDTNYSRDKGGNYHMGLMYDSGNNITFSKDDDPVIIIKNDAVKNVGGFHKFCSEIEKECEQKMSEGKKYYFEDYLKDEGFIEKEKEEDLDKLMKELEALRSKVMKELGL